MSNGIVWRRYYSVGHTSLDAQHKQILGIISDLHAAMEGNRGDAVLRELLDRLYKYTNIHFDHEEQVMREHSFPGLGEHKAQHERMRRKTADLRAHLSLVTAPDLLRFLKQWWTEHIQYEDKAYAPYVQVQLTS